MEKELLIHQAAAIAAWLKEQKLDKTLESFEKAIGNELDLKYGAETRLPTEARGQWQWVPQKTIELQDEENDDEEDESDSEESDSSEDSSDSSSESESESSEYETDSEADADSDSKEIVVAKKAGSKSDQVEEGAAVSVVDEKTSEVQPDPDGANPKPKPMRRVPGRSVSFDDSMPNEFFYSPIRKSEKANVYWTKKELRDIKNEEAMERMASIMAGSVFTVPGLSPSNS